ncbi:MAG: A24 family peptidase [Eubacterium sp.]|nr:A24 family peptidase [Eubacterium sp.]
MVRFVVPFFFLSAAVASDIGGKRVSNELIVLGWFTSLLIRLAECDSFHLGRYLLDTTVPIVVLFLLFSLHALGAGDIKIFSMVGSFTGISFCFYVIWFSFLLAAVYAVLRLAFEGRLLSRITGNARYLFNALKGREKNLYEWKVDGRGTWVRFSVPILISYLCCVALHFAAFI